MQDALLADIFTAPSPSLSRKRKSPATPRRERAQLANSWDDMLASRRALKASFNNEDLNLLLDSIERYAERSHFYSPWTHELSDPPCPDIPHATRFSSHFVPR